MKIDQPLPRQKPQPVEKWHRRICNVFFESSFAIQPGVLKDIRGVDSSLQATIHPETDHLFEASSMFFEQIRDDLRLPIGSLLNEFCFVGIVE